MHRILPRVLACLCVCVIAAAPLCARAADAPKSTIDQWEWDVDHIAKQLPSWETPEERAWGDRGLPALPNDPPPLQPIRNVAEYEPMTEVLIRFPLGIPYVLIREMALNCQIACVVDNANYTTARTNFQSNGVDPNQVDWIVCPTDSYWTRDYGPWFVFDGNGNIGIGDNKYNRPQRPNDDRVPIYCAQHWGIPCYTQDLVHTGGNYMTDGYGISFSTDLVWNENPSMTHDQIFQRMHDYYGLNTYNVVHDIEDSGIHHIDCWAKLLDEETVLMKQVAPNHPDYTRLEQSAALVASLQSATGRNYKVPRVYCQSIGGTNVASYTNSLILNRKVLVPTFNMSPYDDNALQAYRNAMPGYSVIGFYYGGWLTDDALHCRTMGVADFHMLRVAHIPIVEWHAYSPIEVSAFIDDRSQTGLVADSLLVYWRAYPSGGQAPGFTASVMTPTGDPNTYAAFLPPEANGTTVDYYVHAVDNSGRRQGMPRTEPVAWYSFDVTLPTSDVADGNGGGTTLLAPNTPNPFRGSTTFSFELKYADQVRLAVYDAQGRLVRTLLDGQAAAGKHRVEWNGRGDGGAPMPAGVYVYELRAAGIVYTRKAVLAK